VHGAPSRVHSFVEGSGSPTIQASPPGHPDAADESGPGAGSLPHRLSGIQCTRLPPTRRPSCDTNPIAATVRVDGQELLEAPDRVGHAETPVGAVGSEADRCRAQHAAAAILAISRRRSRVRAIARAGPPRLPSSAAAARTVLVLMRAIVRSNPRMSRGGPCCHPPGPSAGTKQARETVDPHLLSGLSWCACETSGSWISRPPVPASQSSEGDRRTPVRASSRMNPRPITDSGVERVFPWQAALHFNDLSQQLLLNVLERAIVESCG
jgi:hypothetical protein